MKAVLSKYLEMTKDNRGSETGLSISFQKSFKPVSVETLCRLLECIMAQAGIVSAQRKIEQLTSIKVKQILIYMLHKLPTNKQN